LLDGNGKGWGYNYHFGKKVNFMLHFPSWATKEFQLPSNGVGMCLMVIEMFWSPQRGPTTFF
jgi:hypothetical protein